jgi:hypothetical protein
MIRLLNDGFGGTQGMMEDKIRQVSVLQRYRAHEQRFFLGANPQGHSAVVFNRYSRHGRIPLCTYSNSTIEKGDSQCSRMLSEPSLRRQSSLTQTLSTRRIR